MRTLLGIDADEYYVPALKLLGRLRFADNHVTLAHVDAFPLSPISPSPLVYASYDNAELQGRMRQAGEAFLAQGQANAKAAGLEETETRYTLGNSSATLMQMAEEGRSDLVVVGSHRLGPVGSFFLGSVGRALAVNGETSFLVGRSALETDAPVHAVFATDFSEYAERAFLRLLDMAPKGLGRVTIVTATDPRMENRLADEAGVSGPGLLTEIERRMRETGEKMVTRLASRGIDAEFRMTEGHPVEVVHRTMAETNADLLILGARGHGLIERVLIGSLALHQVVAESYSVLVLRFTGSAE